MEKETRTNKYKDLRDSFDEENVAVEETVNEDDDFLAFLPPRGKVEDTLSRPLSYETIEESESTRSAIQQARENVGKQRHQTRMDILNDIKINNDDTIDLDRMDDDFSIGHEVKKDRMTLMEQFAAMSPEEDVEELRQFEQGIQISDPVMKESEPEVLSRKEVKELKKQEKQVRKQEKRIQKESKKKEKPVKEKPVKEKRVKEVPEKVENAETPLILNIIVILLILAFIGILGYLVVTVFL